jgi:hypothetical protein
LRALVLANCAVRDVAASTVAGSLKRDHERCCGARIPAVPHTPQRQRELIERAWIQLARRG